MGRRRREGRRRRARARRRRERRRKRSRRPRRRRRQSRRQKQAAARRPKQRSRSLHPPRTQDARRAGTLFLLQKCPETDRAPRLDGPGLRGAALLRRQARRPARGRRGRRRRLCEVCRPGPDRRPDPRAEVGRGWAARLEAGRSRVRLGREPRDGGDARAAGNGRI